MPIFEWYLLMKLTSSSTLQIFEILEHNNEYFELIGLKHKENKSDDEWFYKNQMIETSAKCNLK